MVGIEVNETSESRSTDSSRSNAGSSAPQRGKARAYEPNRRPVEFRKYMKRELRSAESPENVSTAWLGGWISN